MPSTEQNPKLQTRVLALDYGRVHTGAAISDPTGTIARPLDDFKNAGTPDGLKKINSLVARESVGLVVVGMPVSLSGGMGGQAHDTAEFVRALSQKLPVPVVTRDERFTSKIADHKARFSSASRHSLAASILLEEYLGSSEFRRRSES